MRDIPIWLGLCLHWHISNLSVVQLRRIYNHATHSHHRSSKYSGFKQALNSWWFKYNIMGAKESPPWVSRKEASLNGVQSLLHCPAEQSGTKPNLVDKILSTKFGLFCYMYKMFSKILWFSASPWLRCEHLKIWRATNCASFFRKLTSMAGTNQFFKVCAPMSSVKSHTPMDVKLHWAQCVKSNYNRMEPFPIGQI